MDSFEYHFATVDMTPGEEFDIEGLKDTVKSRTQKLVIPPGFQLFQFIEIVGARRASVILVK